MIGVIKMKKVLFPLLILGVFFFITGCDNQVENGSSENTQTSSEPGIEGYVVSKENGRILVVDPKPQDFSKTGGISEFYNAISFSNAPEEIEVGEKVQVWFDVVAESYPGQAKAEKIAVVPTKKSAGALLTEAEAIQKALTSENLDVQELGVLVIRAVDYDEASSQWTVDIKKGEDDFTITVIDKQTDEQTSETLPNVPVEELEGKFKNSIYQEVNETTRQVLNFNSKAELIDDMTQFMNLPLAQYYVDLYFNEEDGKLNLLSMGGPTLLDFDKEYKLVKVDEMKYQAIQVNETDMAGKYELTVTYEHQENRWIMLDREFKNLY